MVGHNHICKKVGHGCNPEFVAVIGKEAKNVKKENARDFILGYTLMIDHAGSPPVFMEDWGMSEYQEEMTLRDHFFHSSYYGNTTCPHPVGPWVVTKEEISDPYNLWISAEEKYEDIRLIEMVSSGSSLFRFEEAVSFMSSIFTLKPGDMISSSSIGYDGYAFRREIIPGSWFQASCSGIGSLRMYLTGKK